MTTNNKTKYDTRFPLPTKETQDEWSAYMQRADDVAYRLLCEAQEHTINHYDVEYNPETDHG